jgi:hypothetical protein
MACTTVQVQNYCASVGLPGDAFCVCMVGAWCAQSGQLGLPDPSSTAYTAYRAWAIQNGYFDPTTNTASCPPVGSGGTCTPACTSGDVCQNGVCVAGTTGACTADQTSLFGMCLPRIAVYGGIAAVGALALLGRGKKGR